jgi:8-oxo-dGTP diphosphatase
MSFTYQYPRPMVTVDVILLSEESHGSILLIQRKNDPFKEKWALPGGFVEMDEDLEDAAIRELLEETSINLSSLKQFKTYGSQNRDPRGRTISVIYYQILENKIDATAGDDAGAAEWYAISELPGLAFDHKTIINDFMNFRSLPRL